LLNNEDETDIVLKRFLFRDILGLQFATHVIGSGLL